MNEVFPIDRKTTTAKNCANPSTAFHDAFYDAFENASFLRCLSLCLSALHVPPVGYVTVVDYDRHMALHGVRIYMTPL